MIDHLPINKPTEARSAVDLATPFGRASEAEKDQMFKTQQRFRFAVAILLFQKGAKREPSIMPHDRSWTESNDPSRLLNSPAEINVVTGLAIFGIEAGHAFKCPAVKGHVTTGNVLGYRVGKQNVIWPARRRSNACLYPILCRRRDVRAAHSGVIATYKRANQIVEPISVRHTVRIGVGQHFAFCGSGTGVAGVTQSMIALMNIAHLRELCGDVGRVVSGTVVHKNDFVRGIIELT